MKKTSLNTLLMIAVASSVAVVGCKKNEPAPAPEVSAPAPLAEPRSCRRTGDAGLADESPPVTPPRVIARCSP